MRTPGSRAERHKPHSWATVAQSGESARRTCDELNGWVVVAVWESKEIWEKFRDETLLPAVQGQGSVLSGPPKTTEFEVEVEL